MSDDVGELSGGDARGAPTLRTIWLVMGAALAWSVGLFVVGLAISTPTNITTNSQGDIVATGGISSAVPFGILSLGVCIVVTQITVRRVPSRFMPVAWVISGGIAITSLIAILTIGPALIPVGAACVMGCVLARRRAQSHVAD